MNHFFALQQRGIHILRAGIKRVASSRQGTRLSNKAISRDDIIMVKWHAGIQALFQSAFQTLFFPPDGAALAGKSNWGPTGA